MSSNKANTQIFLASSSPRRRELLAQLGVEFAIVPSTYEEHNDTAVMPWQLVERQALGKAKAAVLPLANNEGAAQISAVTTESEAAKCVIIGADTIVAVDNQVLGKPRDEEEAKAMLRTLSGRSHEVITGVALLCGERQEVFHCVTKVNFYALTEKEIEAYVATGESTDKAGAYGIQGMGAYLVQGIEGSYTNVVGLPVEVVVRKLRNIIK